MYICLFVNEMEYAQEIHNFVFMMDYVEVRWADMLMSPAC